MEKAGGNCTLDNLISNWNDTFLDFPLTVQDLKIPHKMMTASFHILDRLGIDRDAVLATIPEDEWDANTTYYWDLLPVVNMTRTLNYIVSVESSEFNIYVSHFLHPMVNTSQPILLILFNFMIFNEVRLNEISPIENDVFDKLNQEKSLENSKNNLLGKMNVLAKEKGKQVERVEKVDKDIKQLEEELSQEKNTNNEEKQKLDEELNELRPLEIVIEQKKTHRDGHVAEVARLKSQRVYDADDVYDQVSQAAKQVQEVEEKLNLDKDTLMQKESSLKNLHTIKPCLENANNLINDITRFTQSLNDDDADQDPKDDEMETLDAELAELEAQLSELNKAKQKQQESLNEKQQGRILLENYLREAKEQDKKLTERSNQSMQTIEEIKKATLKYEEEKAKGMQELASIKETFYNEVKTFEECILKRMMETEKKVENKLHNLR